MKKIIEKTFKQNKKHFKNHNKVLLAVSTGIDSMVMLEYFIELKEKFEIDELAVAHVNHGLRAQSKEEEGYLKEFCFKKNIPFHVAHFKGPKEFTENSARDFRYNFFKDLMNKFGYTAVVTAHHKDDQSETVLMRIIRGSRLFDLKGIKEKQVFNNGELIRPFLSLRKSEFPNIFHFEDETNKGTDYFRNRVRNIYIPELEKENVQFSNSLVELSNEVEKISNSFSELIKGINYNDLSTFRKYSEDTQLFFIQDYLTNFGDLMLSKGTIKDIIRMLNNGKCYNQKIKNDYKLIISKNIWEISK